MSHSLIALTLVYPPVLLFNVTFKFDILRANRIVVVVNESLKLQFKHYCCKLIYSTQV